MLLLFDTQLAARRAAIAGPLAPLFESLRGELQPLLGRDVYVPDAKALLSRAGGRCERDGATLDFDPHSPDTHRCPTCGTIHRGEWHHRAWVTSYQLWLAERAVHAALFNWLTPRADFAALARDILQQYARRYLQYPNRDNVLGPTRLFFSTYLESIWLLQICLAADLVERAGDAATAQAVRAEIVEPSRRLIAEFDEGMSNRQVWNNAALLASAELLKDSKSFEEHIEAESGVLAHLRIALLTDSTWYEGDNYHQFALRGLWYCVTLAEACGVQFPNDLRDRFAHAFVTPTLTALPDFTMPARKDSQYAVSLRQWRFAEQCELGFARSQDPRLLSALARCYESGHERHDTGRARSTADVERNGPSFQLTRADLGWRALLRALPELPALTASPPRSALLDGQGYAVFRREGDIYVGVECGQSGGGHAHPDRLNVTLSQGATRWLDDMGTGSYVDPSLHWYRSTLAHNAPLVNGKSQTLTDAVLRAYEEGEGIGWVLSEWQVGDVRLERAVLVSPDYLIDELRWSAPNEVQVDLPIHVDTELSDARWIPAKLSGGSGLEDGFDAVRESRSTPLVPNTTAYARASKPSGNLHCWMWANVKRTLFETSGPGQPSTTTRRFLVQRVRSASGVLRSVLAWAPQIQQVEFGETDGAATDINVAMAGNQRHKHWRDEMGWHIELTVGAAKSGIDLAGFRKIPQRPHSPPKASATPTILRLGEKRTFELGEAHYRRSDESWSAAGEPSAKVTLVAETHRLVVDVRVAARDQRFVAADAKNPFDNEHAETLGAGIQLYARTAGGAGAWMLVPDQGDTVRVRTITATGEVSPPTATWTSDRRGYEVRAVLPIERGQAREYPMDLDIMVNEAPRTHERRRGQLVMSGGSSREFVYLRGDRHEDTRLIPLVIVV